MDTTQDIVFSGHRDVVLIHRHNQMSVHPADEYGVITYLAGSYADPISPPSVTADQVALLFGQFVLLRHDTRARTLTVFTDRFGHYPLYMALVEDRGAPCFYLSTDYAALAGRCGASDAPDHGAMSDILAFNVPFDRRTPSTRISSFGGSDELVINLDTLSTSSRQMWAPQQLLAQATLSFDSVKDQLVELFLEGVAKATAHAHTVGVTLSGGADSRCLLAGSLHAGRKTVVYSTGVPGSRALSYAHGMAQLCGVPENPHPLGDAFLARFPALMQESNTLMQGMSFSSELEAMWLRQHVAPEGVLLHGAFAELYKIGKMHNYHYDADIASLTGGAVSAQLWKRFSGRYALRLQGFEKSYGDALGEQARQHLTEKVTRLQHLGLDTAGVLQLIYIEEFLGKVAKASWQMWRQRIPAMFPFAYPPLVDLILRVRTSDKIDNRFVVHLLRRTNKTLAHYPDSNTGVRIGASRLHREIVHVVDYATNRLFRPKARSDHQDFADWLSRMQPGLEPLFESLQTATDGAFDAAHIAQLIKRCRAGDDLASRTLQFLWAWALWKTETPVAANTV